ncbi:hemoglobin [Sphingobium sp. B1D7B]|uniref:group III truncated hemoglobin n=1 Tax=Sphingobium sp. B1D7B TaxID=2940578 RepID=UPI002223EEB0|nr:group III truncated hemoglobin [Sphingobium sp. B1D7B]MCW2404594.1 hemoglobin [Sphingobium sp. B1D7B]
MSDVEITEQDIARLVPAFYERVRQDPMLGPIFETAIDDWPHHLAKLQDFWSSVMLTTGRYKGQPMAVHVRYADKLTKEAFIGWLNLWKQTTDDILTPAAAARFQDKADRIAESLQLGIDFHHARRAE